MRLYNTRTRSIERFEPLRDGEVRIYVCGLTPSAEPHLGHARSFLFFDLLRLRLACLGYRVRYVQNVTDIDDRSIAAARAEGVPWNEVVERYFSSFKRSMRRLGVREPDHEPRATEYIPQIIEMTERLVAKGHAYVVGDGVYYAVKSFQRYGTLSQRNVDELLIGARIAPGEEKRDPLDFALWKLAKPGEPAWPSPWGDGRPGWHIECSAMSHALLGEPFDLHGGGYDLIFPHHENEIAQSEALLERPPMANFWVHGGLLVFDGKKMSKSLGNFEPLGQLLDRHDPQAIRFLFLQTGYRKPMNFTEDSIGGAAEGLRGLLDAYDLLAQAAGLGRDGDAVAGRGAELIAPHASAFHAALDDDMNTSGAVGELFKLVRSAPSLIEAGAAAAALAFLREALPLLGIEPEARQRPAEPSLGEEFLTRLRSRLEGVLTFDGDAAEGAIVAVIAARNAARAARDFSMADRLRTALAEAGVTLKDGKEGTSWSVEG